jgi:hypothetical protein
MGEDSPIWVGMDKEEADWMSQPRFYIAFDSIHMRVK